MLADIARERPRAAAQMLPLVAAQPGIWMADQIFAASNAYVVAQYVELNGRLDVACFSAAVRLGLAEADLVHARFIETEAGPAQIVPSVPQAVDLPEPELVDLRGEDDPVAAALRAMRVDLEAPLSIAEGAQLYRHILFRLGPAAEPERASSLVLVSALSPSLGRRIRLRGDRATCERDLHRASSWAHAVSIAFRFIRRGREGICGLRGLAGAARRSAILGGACAGSAACRHLVAAARRGKAMLHASIARADRAGPAHDDAIV